MMKNWFFPLYWTLSSINGITGHNTLQSDLQHIVDKPLTILVSHQMGSRSHVKYLFDILYPLQEEGHQIIYATTSDNVHFSKAYNYTTIDLGANPLTIEDLNHIRETNHYKVDFLSKAHLSNGVFPIYFDAKLDSYKPIFNEYNVDLLICDFFNPACVDAGLNKGLPVIIGSHGLPLSEYNLPYLPPNYITPEYYKLNVINKFLHRFVHPYFYNQAVKSGTEKMNQARIRNNMTVATNFWGHMDKALLLSNSFFDWLHPTSLPPHVHMIGPIDTPPHFLDHLTDDLENFLNDHMNVMYIGFGTHLILSSNQLDKLFTAILSALEDGLVDGVIWSLGVAPDYEFPESITINHREYKVNELMSKYSKDIVMKPRLPQYALLKRSEIKLFVSHGGMESLYESFFTATPTLVVPFTVDQPDNAKRIDELNLGEYLILDEVEADVIVTKIRSILIVRKDEIKMNRAKFQLLANFNAQKVSTVRELIKNYAYTHKICTQNQVRGWRNDICELESYLTKSQYMGLLEANMLDVSFFILGLSTSIFGSITFLLIYVFRKFSKTNRNEQTQIKIKDQ